MPDREQETGLPPPSAILDERSPFFEALTELLPVCLFAKDLEGRYVYVNKAFVRTTNQPDSASIIGKKPSEIFAKEHAALAEKEDAEILRTGKPILNRENLNRSWYRKRNYVIVSKICVRDRNGDKLGIAGITLDITQRKKDELRLAELNQELEKRNEQLEEELSLAREVQKGFLRVDDTIGEGQFDIGYRYQPSEKLSGDLIVFEAIDDNRLAVLICDVMGHGIRSALVTGILRGFYDEQKGINPEPASFVSALNRHYTSVLKDLNTLLFTTLTYGILDIRNGDMELTCAGHHDPLWFRTTEGAFVSPGERILHQDPAIGLIKDHAYSSKSLKIQQGDALLFYTDGLTECRSGKDEEFGISAIRAILKEQHEKPSDEIVEKVIAEARDFAVTINDDLSLLLFKYNH